MTCSLVRFEPCWRAFIRSYSKHVLMWRCPLPVLIIFFILFPFLLPSATPYTCSSISSLNFTCSCYSCFDLTNDWDELTILPRSINRKWTVCWWKQVFVGEVGVLLTTEIAVGVTAQAAASLTQDSVFSRCLNLLRNNSEMQSWAIWRQLIWPAHKNIILSLSSLLNP